MTAPAQRVEPLHGMRRTIARRMTESWSAPTFRVSVAVDIESMDVRRRQFDSASLSDELIRCTAAALEAHPYLNAHFRDEAIYSFDEANIGLAVAIDRGLIVPVIKDVANLSLQEIATTRADLVERARAGTLTISDVSGGTFTISNLGMFGVDRFDALLNLPQVAILAVGGAATRVVLAGGAPIERRFCELTLTADHRAVDGAGAASFMKTLKSEIEREVVGSV